MNGSVLILRPQPGADRTAARALTFGLQPTVAPLFTIKPMAWEAPGPDNFDALVLTSANAARHAGDGLTPFLGLPVYAVGEESAAAAIEAGALDVRVGPADGAALLEMMEAQGVRSALHLCGREHRLPVIDTISILSIPVYAADAVDRLPAAAETAILAGTVALIHSARAAKVFGSLVGGQRHRIRIAAISAAAAASAGSGWADIEVSAEPRDHALLEAAAKLCQRGN